MDKWIVHKFGGSSVADAGCFRRVAEIIEASPNPREAVVLSACRGVTDALLALVTLAENPEGYFPSAIEALKRRHVELARSLVSKEACASYCVCCSGFFTQQRRARIYRLYNSALPTLAGSSWMDSARPHLPPALI